MFKKMIAVALSALIATSVMPLSAFAAEMSDSSEAVAAVDAGSLPTEKELVGAEEQTAAPEVTEEVTSLPAEKNPTEPITEKQTEAPVEPTTAEAPAQPEKEKDAETVGAAIESDEAVGKSSFTYSVSNNQVTITGLSDGIYALTAQAFHRPGQGHEGLIDGTDVIPAELFVNNFTTPVLSVYADKISYSDAQNGINCRYDATEDESAPHNGEQTGSVDIDTEEGDGYFVPDNIYTSSFAFNGDRYNQTAYGIVKDGKLTIGIRNGDTPWRNKNLTIWGNFRLTFLGESSNAISAILDQYTDRVELLDQQRYDQEYYISQSHLDAIRGKIDEARNADTETQLQLIEEINAEFQAVPASADIYKRLFEIAQFASDMIDGLEPGDLQDELATIYEELEGIVVEGSLTDEECRRRMALQPDVLALSVAAEQRRQVRGNCYPAGPQPPC